MSRVFISGVAGFLGSHLADAFLDDGHEVVGVDNMIGGYLDNVPDRRRVLPVRLQRLRSSSRTT